MLQKRGFRVIAAPIPLTSLSDDAAALRRTIARTGPVIVAGHAYAGAVVGCERRASQGARLYRSPCSERRRDCGAGFLPGESHPKAPTRARCGWIHLDAR